MRVVALGGDRQESDRSPTITADQAKITAGYVPGYRRDFLQGTLTDWLAEFRYS